MLSAFSKPGTKARRSTSRRIATAATRLQLEAGPALPPEQRLAINDLLTLATAAGAPPPTSHKTLPWLLRVEQLMFGQWQACNDDQVCCPACGSQEVGRKSATPRNKRYYDAQGQLQTVAVYRYYPGGHARATRAWPDGRQPCHPQRPSGGRRAVN